MYGDENNLKDSENTSTDSAILVSDIELSLSYKKTNKLVTALFMVTDMMEKDEPIRLKLRTLGVEILSDTTSLSKQTFASRTDVILHKNIQETVHFLELAETVNMISKMNASILKKEFFALKTSFEDYAERIQNFGGKATLSEFFHVEEKFSITPPIKHEKYSIGQINSTRIGVQKGSTLMKALSDKILAKNTNQMSVRKDIQTSFRPKHETNSNTENPKTKETFDLLKKQRRNEIIEIIKTNGDSPEGVGITDIKNSLSGSLVSASEKTLQRELVSMVSEGVLKKKGSKRWSRYFLV